MIKASESDAGPAGRLGEPPAQTRAVSESHSAWQGTVPAAERTSNGGLGTRKPVAGRQ